MGIFRWLHIMAGITWIGLLYYFNLVQMPAMKDAAADGTAAGISKHVAPRALLWFRWAAVATWLMGAALLGPHFIAAFGLQAGFTGIGIGSCNGSRLNSIVLQATMNNAVKSYPAGITVYAINYNVLRIAAGLGGVLFTV